ncbi:Cyclindependent kinase 17like, partial [Caligus rogercresseyi]
LIHKSSSFSALSSGSAKIGSWFDRRARKLSMKCSRSITLGKSLSYTAAAAAVN